MAISKSLNVNGKQVSIQIDDPEMPLLYALRDNLALKGPRFGCGLEQCGACTVHIDGKAVRSCVKKLSEIKPSKIESGDFGSQVGIQRRSRASDFGNRKSITFTIIHVERDLCDVRSIGGFLLQGGMFRMAFKLRMCL